MNRSSVSVDTFCNASAAWSSAATPEALSLAPYAVGTLSWCAESTRMSALGEAAFFTAMTLLPRRPWLSV